MDALIQDFTQPLDPRLKQFLAGGGRLEHIDGGLRLWVPPSGADTYVDAQLDDYHGLRRGRFPWRPPLRMAVRARLSHSPGEMGGTVGFGFWNDPFTLTGGGVLAAPNNLWFFNGSPPNDMYLVDGLPGHGWKAATLNAGRYPSLLVAPPAAVAIALTKVPRLGRPIMRLVRRFVRAGERLLPPEIDPTGWHDYRLDWQRDKVDYWVDGEHLLTTHKPPRGPLGLVIWIDNQYAIVSEAGQFKFGLVENTEAHWLDLATLAIEPLGPPA